MLPRTDVVVTQFGANSMSWGMLYGVPQMKIGGGGASTAKDKRENF